MGAVFRWQQQRSLGKSRLINSPSVLLLPSSLTFFHFLFVFKIYLFIFGFSYLFWGFLSHRLYTLSHLSFSLYPFLCCALCWFVGFLFPPIFPKHKALKKEKEKTQQRQKRNPNSKKPTKRANITHCSATNAHRISFSGEFSNASVAGLTQEREVRVQSCPLCCESAVTVCVFVGCGCVYM